MNFSSYQIKPSSFVADTSVIINLNATEYAASIIQCTIKKLYITPQVYRELDSGKNQGHNDKEKIDLLIKQGLVVLLPLKKWESPYTNSLLPEKQVIHFMMEKPPP